MSLRALLEGVRAWWRGLVGTDLGGSTAVLHDVAPRRARKVAPAKRTGKATQARRGSRKPRKR